MAAGNPSEGADREAGGSTLARDLAGYTAARLALVAVVAGLLAAVGVPVLVAVLLGLVVAMPLSLVLLRGMRGRVQAGLAESRRRRKAERDRLRAQLRGEADEQP